MTVTVLNHPVAMEQLSVLRDKRTSNNDFRLTLSRLAGIIALEASKDLPVTSIPDLNSPLGSYSGSRLSSRIGLAPIMRSGLGMENSFLEYFPDARVYHLGLFRDKKSLHPVEYYSRLPKTVNVDILYILDPLLGTGNTAIAALRMIEDWGVPAKSVKILSVLGSQRAIDNITRTSPDVQIVVAGIDDTLTETGYIVPGCGDVGDRLYNSF